MTETQQIVKELQTIRASDVPPEVVTWIWEDYLPLGEIVIFSGNPDVGKGCALSDIVSRITRQADFPTGPCANGGEVLMMSAEEKIGKLSARLNAAGADMDAVYLLKKVTIRDGAKQTEREFALDEDLKTLEQYLTDNPSITLVTIDPISSYFGRGKMNDKQEVRRVITPLQELCEKFKVTIIGVEHFNKQVGLSALHRVGGSVALTAGPRAAFMFAKVPDEDGQYAMHYIKGNDAKKKVGLRYSIDGKFIKHGGAMVCDDKGNPVSVPYIVWGGEASGTADDLLKAEIGTREDNSTERARAFVGKITEPTPVDDVYDAAKSHGIGRDATRKAIKELGKSRSSVKGGSWTFYPNAVDAGAAPALFPTHSKPDDGTGAY